MQHLVQLILTRPGERVMLPQFGTEALNMLFGSVDAITGVQLATSLRQAIDLWEPGIKVHDLRPLYEEPNTLAVSVKFSVPPSEEVLSTVVEVGGSVRGEIGG